VAIQKTVIYKEGHMINFAESALRNIDKNLKLNALTLPKKLADTRYPFGIFSLSYKNWAADKARKVYFMEMKMRVPKMHQQGIAIYPADGIEMPVFMADITWMKKKSICYINVIPTLRDEAYMENCIAPFNEVHSRFSDLPRDDMPEWMQSHRTPNTLFYMSNGDYIDGFIAAAHAYLDRYLDMLDSSQPVEDHERHRQITAAQSAFCRELVEKDRTRLLLGKVVGKKKANRIFEEVLV
jgi:hypothetical protein